MKPMTNLLLLTVITASSAVTHAHAGDLPQTYVPAGAPIFEERFRTLDAGPDQAARGAPSHRWRTIVKGGADAGARSLSGGTFFGDTTTGENPFRIGSGGLTITAKRVAGLPFGKTWNSGFLSTKFSFSFLHGYAETDADLPTCVKGAWPAPLWLLPVSGDWPLHGEVDAPETIGKVDPRTGMGANHWGVISKGAAGVTRWGAETPMPCARGRHTYGILWRPDQIGFYLDRRLVAQTATPSDFTQPMYLLMDLIVGGAWPGPPDPALQSVEMSVNRVSVWR